jgi:hypothetical protein
VNVYCFVFTPLLPPVCFPSLQKTLPLLIGGKDFLVCSIPNLANDESPFSKKDSDRSISSPGCPIRFYWQFPYLVNFSKYLP